MFSRTFPRLPIIHLERTIGNGRKLIMVGVDTDADLKASSPSKFLARGSFVEQLRQAEDLFDGDPKVEIRVLVMHHSRMNRQLVGGIQQRSQEALDEFIRRHRISVLLTGHVHVCRSEGETIGYGGDKWRLLESRCGTTSVRDLRQWVFSTNETEAIRVRSILNDKAEAAHVVSRNGPQFT